MHIGFIGAGRVGVSLGKYFKENGLKISGYLHHKSTSAKDAADFVNCEVFTNIIDLITVSSIIFVTVPDNQIKSVWNKLKQHSLQDKIICHTSGSLGSDVFTDIKTKQAFGFSLHPMFAFASKKNTYQELNNAHFTIEGELANLTIIKKIITTCGNSFTIIGSKDKALYHLANVMASNFVLALLHKSTNHLVDCGFNESDAICALYPLIDFNLKHIKDCGFVNSLTGPVERADSETLEKHLKCLKQPPELQLYKLLSQELVKLSAVKNPLQDYAVIEKLLDKKEN